MEIGTGLIMCQRRPDDPRTMTEIYDEMLELAVAADEAELDSIWVSEHHFTEDGYLPGTMPSLGAIGARTDQIEFGPYCAVTPLYDPVRLAEDAATLSLMSDDRFTLGLVNGYRKEEFRAFGIPREERPARVTDTVSILRNAWSDGPLDYESEFHPIPPETTVTPKPDVEPRIILGGFAKPAVRRAARMADGWAGDSATLSLDDIVTRVEDIQRVREEHSIDRDFKIYVGSNGFIGDSREDAWEKMKEGYFHTRRQYGKYFDGIDFDDSQETRRKAKENAIFGTPEQVVEEIAEFKRALGDDIHFLFKVYHPGIGTDTMKTCIERLGDEVIPELR